jgi:DNA-binding NarL/FixJ family response regulator
MEISDVLPIRLILLDDHDVARRQSAARLSQNPTLEVIGHTADPNDALNLVRELEPDAILVETRRLDERGLQAIALLSAIEKPVRPAVVAYLEIVHRDDWPAAHAVGADDVLLRELPTETLVKELRHVVGHVREGDRSRLG